MKNQVVSKQIQKWAPLLKGVNQQNASAITMLQSEKKQYGPYYCDETGKCVLANDTADPKYIPHVKFWSETIDGGFDGRRTFVYNWPNSRCKLWC